MDTECSKRVRGAVLKIGIVVLLLIIGMYFHLRSMRRQLCFPKNGIIVVYGDKVYEMAPDAFLEYTLSVLVAIRTAPAETNEGPRRTIIDHITLAREKALIAKKNGKGFIFDMSFLDRILRRVDASVALESPQEFIDKHPLLKKIAGISASSSSTQPDTFDDGSFNESIIAPLRARIATEYSVRNMEREAARVNTLRSQSVDQSARKALRSDYDQYIYSPTI